MFRRLRQSARGDGGFAIAIVMLAGMILVLITAVVGSRAARQVGTVSGDIRWEQSLHVAESCLDVGLLALDTDFDWDTGETLDPGLIGTGAERDWAVESSEARGEDDLVVTPEGDCIIVKPSNVDLLYAVGFTPDRSSAERRVRVVRVALSLPGSMVQLTYAFLTNDDLWINGNPDWHGAAASAHTNGEVEVTGNPTFHDGCLTASNGGIITGNLNVHSSCSTTPYDQPQVIIPEINPRDFWFMSEYDLCPDGSVHAGPAHPTLAGTAGALPCSGLVVEPDASIGNGYRGWEFEGCCDEVHWAEWRFNNDISYHGAYYVYQGSVLINGSPGSMNNPWRVLTIVEPVGSCPDHTGGDIRINGNQAMGPYTAGSAHADNSFVAVAGRDIDWNGNGKLSAPGIMAAVEQIDINGNLDAEGGFIGENRCDSVNDEIDLTYINGNPTFTLDGELNTIWELGPGELSVIGWDEL